MTYEIDLTGHRALVTGAGQGVGEEIARTLAQAGAEVLVNDLVLERAQRVVDAIVADGGEARPSVFDVTDYDAVVAAIAQDGPVDILARDESGASVAVEIKRRGGIDGVEQLTRYLELMNRDPLLAPVSGVFAAQEIAPQARTLAEDRGIRCVILDYDEMRDKHNYMQKFSVDNDEDIARTLAMFGGFTEGVQLFASFAMLMNFPRFNKMKGMGQIVSWSVRDESLHCEGITRMFHAFTQERDCLTKAVKDDIADVCQTTIRLEDAFIDLAFEMGPVQGMTPKEIKKYIRYIADWRLTQLGLKPIYLIDEHPLPWLTPLLNGVEHANFFEQRATEYSKAATRGNWNEVWSSFDQRQKARAANEVEEAVLASDDHDLGLFGRAGMQAAE